MAMRFRLGFLFLALTSGLQAQDLNPYKLDKPITATPPAAVLSSAPTAASGKTPTLSPGTSSTFTSQVLETQPGPSRAWFRSEYFIGVIRKPELPPLIRSIPAATVLQSNSVGGPVLYPNSEGKQRIDYNAFAGGRAEAGFWFNDERTRGLEASGFLLEQRQQSSLFTNEVGNPNFLTRFFLDANNNSNVFLFFVNANGPVSASGRTKVSPIYNLELNYVAPGYNFLADRTDYLYGFRYFDQRETLRVDLRQDIIGGGLLSVTDQFATTNQFYGANFGIRSHYYATNRFGAETTFKLAAGSAEQRAIINGSTLINVPGVPVVNVAEGVYARSTNSGVRSRDFFTVIPEVNLRLNYAITPRAKVYAGYDLVYISAVVRPGLIIDPVVNSGNLQILNPTDRVVGPNTSRPGFRFDATDELIHSFSFGMSVDF